MSTVIDKTTERALSKCKKMYFDGVVAVCTPVEYVALCKYFGHPAKTIRQYYLDAIKVGKMNQTHHYFRVTNWSDHPQFPVSKYEMQCAMSGPQDSDRWWNS